MEKMNFWKIVVVIGFLALGIISIGSCKHEIPKPLQPPDTTIPPVVPPGTSNCSKDTVYFQNSILPLILSNCAKSGCHNSGGNNDVIFTDYSSVYRKVKPGKPGSSKLYEVITTSDPGDLMPPTTQTPLTSSQKNLIYTWILQGAKNNKCTDSCDLSEFTFNKTVHPIIKNYCEGCHSGTSPGAGINLADYAGISQQAQNGKLYGTVSHTTGYKPMPEGIAMLNSCYINIIKKWIDAGYQNN